MEHICKCGESVHPKRVALGYRVCLDCGDREARMIVRVTAPLSKSNYILITNHAELKMLNPKCVNN